MTAESAIATLAGLVALLIVAAVFNFGWRRSRPEQTDPFGRT